MSGEELQLQSEKLWVGNLDLRITEFQLLQILQKYGEIEHFNFVYHTKGPNVGEPKGFAFVKFKDAEHTINALTNLNNRKVLGKNIAVRYAKHIDYEDDGKGKNLGSSMQGSTIATGSHKKFSDKKSKIQLIEEQLRRIQSAADDFELNKGKEGQAPSEPLIKKYQYNKDAPSTSSSSRYQSYHKRKRRPY